MKIPVVFYTDAFEYEGEAFDQLIAILETITVKEIIINHYSYNESPWSFERFKLLADRFFIASVEMSCFDITKSNLIEYVKLLSKLQGKA